MGERGPRDPRARHPSARRRGGHGVREPARPLRRRGGHQPGGGDGEGRAADGGGACVRDRAARARPDRTGGSCSVPFSGGGGAARAARRGGTGRADSPADQDPPEPSPAFPDADDYGALTRAVRLAERALETGYEAQDWPGFGCAAAEAQYLLGAYRGSRRPLERAVEISSRVWSTAGEGLAVRAWTVCGAAHRELFAYTGDIFDLQAALDALQPQVRRARGGDRGGS